MAVNHKGFRTWIEVDTHALKHNFDLLRGLISPSCKLCVVAKSNAYGHGLIDYVQYTESLGVDMVAVDSIVEAINLRKNGVTCPLLVLGYTLPERVSDAVKNDIQITVSTFELLHEIIDGEWQKKPQVHIKVDTGMGRQGFLKTDADKIFSLLMKSRDTLDIAGVFTHFSQAKNPAFPKETQKQIGLFTWWKEEFQKHEFAPIFHAAASSGTLLFPEAHFDMVRIGISMFGEWPSEEVRGARRDAVPLKSALTWKTVVGEVKHLSKNSGIGYDATDMLSRDSTIAVCPVGYWHGYSRSLSSVGHVQIRGQEVKVLGRVSMDMIVLDVTDIPDVTVEDEVVLCGGGVPVGDVARLSGTVNYEFLTRINPLIKRFYI